MLTKLLAGALLVAAATTANAATNVTFANFSPVGTDSNITLTGLNLTSSSLVDFKYLIPELSPLGTLSATLTLAGTETGAIGFGPISLASFDGTFNFSYNGPDGIFSGVNMHTGDSLLSGSFLGSVFTGYGTSGSLIDSIIAGGLVSFDSHFVEFDPLADQGFGLGITSISPVISVIGGKLTDFTGVATGNYAATVTGVNYHNDVPEPESWALMVAGFGVLGLAMRRSRRTTVSVVMA